MTSSQPKLAVIGAGISGLICARQVQNAGWQVTVLEKSRGVGGFSFYLTVRGRSILEAAKGKSGLLSLVGLPHLKLRPLALAFAAIGGFRARRPQPAA
jgi:glycine/D-amino acid oxidase-like deaminating enzyme